MDVIDREGGVGTAALSTDAPCLVHDEVRALARRLYGIDGRIAPLAGERDQNCRIEAADGRCCVLKISNPSESVGVVDFQIAALDHIARAMERLLQDDIGIEKFNSRIVLRQPFGKRSCPLGLIAAARA